MTGTAIRPFTIDIPQADLDDLRERLSRTRWPSELAGQGWSRGVPLAYQQELAAYWAKEYDWREHESGLNARPQFVTDIDGLEIHFLHVRSARTDATPLLLVHGWPGSVVEFLEVIEPLVSPASAEQPAFHLVIPSVPGHGFSQAPTEAGWTHARTAAVFTTLMARLGYERYGVQGGDIGAFIAPLMGRAEPEAVIGVHLNALVTFPSGDTSGLTDAEQARLAMFERFGQDLNGYMQVQGQRPQTIAYALADSPAGQLAWIVEKFHDWTDPAAVLPEDAVDRDRILTNVSIYWFTNTARSSANQYYETFHDFASFAPRPRSTVPTGVAVFPGLDVAIRRFAEITDTVVHWSEFDRGGHFAALEAPDLLVADVRSFFGALIGGRRPRS
jgi:pimeloyl-ACP methyl ester carboxylesterase